MAISLVFQRAMSSLFALSFITVITACGGGGGGSSGPANTSSSVKSTGVSSTSSSVKSSSSSTANTSTANDGIGAAARFNKPAFIVREGGYLYVTEQESCTVRKITIATGAVTTLAGIAGACGSADGVGAAARFAALAGITSDGTNLYVVDSANHTVRKIVIATGAVTTIAGAAGKAGSDDGVGAAASFFFPVGIAYDGSDLYVTSNGTVRKIVIATGSVTTFVGDKTMSGSNDGVGAGARFFVGGGITTDGTNLYVTDSFGNTVRKVVIATKTVTTLAGTAPWSGSMDGTGAAATFNNPTDITSDGVNLYVSDTNNKTIRKINIETAAVTTFAGTTNVVGSVDAVGAAASFNMPYGITTDGTNLYVTDIFNSTIRKITIATGAVTTLAGKAGVSGTIQ